MEIREIKINENVRTYEVQEDEYFFKFTIIYYYSISYITEALSNNCFGIMLLDGDEVKKMTLTNFIPEAEVFAREMDIDKGKAAVFAKVIGEILSYLG